MSTLDYKVGGLSNLSFDVDADGNYLNIAVEDAATGNPQLLKFSSNLDEDATIIFDPGAGTSIHVLCGNKNSYIIWVCGNFGTYYTISQYNGEENAYWYPYYEYWYAPDPYWYDESKPMHLGPEDLDILLVNNNVGDLSSLFTTVHNQNGVTFSTLSSNLPINVQSIDRRGIDPNQIIIGGDDSTYWYKVEYSYNNGIQFGDVSFSLAQKTCAITSVVLAS